MAKVQHYPFLATPPRKASVLSCLLACPSFLCATYQSSTFNSTPLYPPNLFNLFVIFGDSWDNSSISTTLSSSSSSSDREPNLVFPCAHHSNYHRNVPGAAMYFTVLNESRTLLARRKINGMERTDVHSSSSALPKLSNTENLIAGGASRAAIGFVMMPATVIKVRYEVTKEKNMFCNFFGNDRPPFSGGRLRYPSPNV